MNGASHAIVGGTLGLAIGGPMGMVLGAAGSLLPDIDHPGSTISRIIFPKETHNHAGRVLVGAALVAVATFVKSHYLLWVGIGVLALAFIPHRGVLHTPAFLLLLGSAYYIFGDNSTLIACLLLGYGSHILMDSFTTDGAPLLWPIHGKKWGIRLIKTGSTGEYLIVGLVLIMAYFLLG